MAQKAHADGGTERPMNDPSDERQAIRDRLPSNLYVLQWHGSEPFVAVAKRDSTPQTEHPGQGETIALIEWHGGEDHAVSLAEGELTGWQLTDAPIEDHLTRSEAVCAAERYLNEAGE